MNPDFLFEILEKYLNLLFPYISRYTYQYFNKLIALKSKQIIQKRCAFQKNYCYLELNVTNKNLSQFVVTYYNIKNEIKTKLKYTKSFLQHVR